MNETTTEECKYTIIGYLNKWIEEYVEFTLHLALTPFYKTQHILPKSKTYHIYISCQLVSPTPSFVFIGQQVIRNGLMEVFALLFF